MGNVRIRRHVPHVRCDFFLQLFCHLNKFRFQYIQSFTILCVCLLHKLKKNLICEKNSFLYYFYIDIQKCSELCDRKERYMTALYIHVHVYMSHHNQQHVKEYIHIFNYQHNNVVSNTISTLITIELNILIIRII